MMNRSNPCFDSGVEDVDPESAGYSARRDNQQFRVFVDCL